MVSLITEGHTTDPHGRPYKRRRPVPLLILAGILAAAAGIVWIQVLTIEKAPVSAIDCNDPPPGSPPVGEQFSRSEMVKIRPAPLPQTQVRVYNANGEAGQASSVAAQLSDLGYEPAPDVQAGNDPVYTDQNLQCHGQIRFGPEGRAAASTLWLAAPCAELIEDAREDTTVDLALGTYFRTISPSPEAEVALQLLRGDGGDGPEQDVIDSARSALC
ncbi:envelope integrity protein Cei [Hoyosella sp. YIM 151337]|uniref:envelope integrity protein Cei n=1 Tax=Hoyosella sp. YIM 151337 TaxID=2992742 RepID=UPI00223662B4|nr:envelope integrity protein Cei [Hoyosella sp. YIM 151337]MCW4353296.1 envelope integrity protein Cei [Hoyosella sp. YIM 151337]